MTSLTGVWLKHSHLQRAVRESTETIASSQRTKAALFLFISPVNVLCLHTVTGHMRVRYVDVLVCCHLTRDHRSRSVLRSPHWLIAVINRQT